jgi:hypothetical protein
VSSESGWSPNPELLARRQYVRTKWGWFPKEDAFGGGEFLLSLTRPIHIHRLLQIFLFTLWLTINTSFSFDFFQLVSQQSVDRGL